jgi:hypothetical protein
MPLIIGQKGSSRCCCGDCRGFPAFDGSHRFFKYATAYDTDCCQFGQCVDANGQDGIIKFASTGCGYGIVVESTGNYLSSLRNGVCIDCKSLYPLDSIWDMRAIMYNPYVRCYNYYATAPGVINPTKATALYNYSCCNGQGDKIYWELTEEITDGTCVKMGACCGWKTYASASGNLDDKTTCRLCHECECDTSKGETWHGEGSLCEPNPCICEGFKAFDGSDQYFRYATVVDADDCFFTGDNNDGSFTVEWDNSCSCGVTQANTSMRSNAGKVISVSGGQSLFHSVGDCVQVPSTFVAESIHNSATFCSLGASAVCGNPEGNRIGWTLSASISCNPLP